MKRFTRKYNKDEIAKQNLNADCSEHIISKEDYTIDSRQPVQEGLNKFGQLEDIEDELGIDLVTLFKALLNGIYYKGAYGTNNYGKIVYHKHPTILFEVTGELYCFKPTFFDFVYLQDYGNTWALTKEELL